VGALWGRFWGQEEEKSPLWKDRRGTTGAPPLIFQNEPVLPELAPGAGTDGHRYGMVSLRPGCRGFTGPVPPPLWIRVPPGLFNCWLNHTTKARFVKEEQEVGVP